MRAYRAAPGAAAALAPALPPSRRLLDRAQEALPGWRSRFGGGAGTDSASDPGGGRRRDPRRRHGGAGQGAGRLRGTVGGAAACVASRRRPAAPALVAGDEQAPARLERPAPEAAAAAPSEPEAAPVEYEPAPPSADRETAPDHGQGTGTRDQRRNRRRKPPPGRSNMPHRRSRPRPQRAAPSSGATPRAAPPRGRRPGSSDREGPAASDSERGSRGPRLPWRAPAQGSPPLPTPTNGSSRCGSPASRWRRRALLAAGEPASRSAGAWARPGRRHRADGGSNTGFADPAGAPIGPRGRVDPRYQSITVSIPTGPRRSPNRRGRLLPRRLAQWRRRPRPGLDRRRSARRRAAAERRGAAVPEPAGSGPHRDSRRASHRASRRSAARSRESAATRSRSTAEPPPSPARDRTGCSEPRPTSTAAIERRLAVLGPLARGDQLRPRGRRLRDRDESPVGRRPATRLRVDGTPPALALSGAPDGWSSQPVELIATRDRRALGDAARRAPAGPLTAIVVDGGAASVAAGPRVTAVVRRRRTARGLGLRPRPAGNVTDGCRPRLGRSRRLDRRNGPAGRLRRRQDPGEPERIVALVADPLSGPSHAREGSIAVRPAGTRKRFEPLPTEVSGGRCGPLGLRVLATRRVRVPGHRLRRRRQLRDRPLCGPSGAPWCSQPAEDRHRAARRVRRHGAGAEPLRPPPGCGRDVRQPADTTIARRPGDERSPTAAAPRRGQAQRPPVASQSPRCR